MPSPIGHGLGALAIGWAVSGRAPRGHLLGRSLWIAAFGLAADLDLLIGRHSMETHSFGAALLAGALAALLRWPLASTRVRIFLTAVLAWSTHPILDALGADTSPPFGVMMFWPLSGEHVMFGEVFLPISRRWWLPGFVAGNLAAAVREVAVLGPAALLTWIFAQRLTRRDARVRAGDQP